MVTVKFEGNQALVSVEIDASAITESRGALLAAQRAIDSALTVSQKTDSEVQAEVAAEAAARIAARPEVTGLAEHIAAIEAAERAKNGGDSQDQPVETGDGGDVGASD